MNQASSRSHAIFTIVVESEARRGNKKLARAGKVNLVDLAGSERLYKEANSQAMLKEGKAINLSLHFLEQVIVNLRDQAKKAAATTRHRQHRHPGNEAPPLVGCGSSGSSHKGPVHASGSAHAHTHTHSQQQSHGLGHIPYRNSVLTNMLRDSLGGNCKSCFLLTLSAEEEHFEESVSTARCALSCCLCDACACWCAC